VRVAISAIGDGLCCCRSRRFIVFHGKRHPRDLGAPQVTAFLTHLAAAGASASTQNQALSAILFLFEVVLGRRLPWMDGIVRAQRPIRLPVVLSRSEIAGLLGQLRGTTWLMAALMYGSGLRVMEWRSTTGISRPGLERWHCRAPWRRSIRTRTGSGRGNGYFRRRDRISMARRESAGGITCTRQ
jgi:integrase